MSGVNTTDPKEAPEETVEYQVVVTRIRHNVKVREKSFENLGTTKKNEYGKEEAEYGYVYSDNYNSVSEKVYEQIVAEIDMPDVIKAINKMEK